MSKKALLVVASLFVTWLSVAVPGWARGEMQDRSAANHVASVAQDPAQGVPKDWSVNKADGDGQVKNFEATNNNPSVTTVKVTNGKNSSKVTVTIRNAKGEMIAQDTIKPGEATASLPFPQGATMTISPPPGSGFQGAHGQFIPN